MPSVIIFGGCGALGNVTVQKFKEAGWVTIAVDLKPSTSADHSIEIKGGGKEDAQLIFNKLKEFSIRKRQFCQLIKKYF
jgi:nucleoside-diphosphate-sugar epimerase